MTWSLQVTTPSGSGGLPPTFRRMPRGQSERGFRVDIPGPFAGKPSREFDTQPILIVSELFPAALARTPGAIATANAIGEQNGHQQEPPCFGDRSTARREPLPRATLGRDVLGIPRPGLRQPNRLAQRVPARLRHDPELRFGELHAVQAGSDTLQVLLRPDRQRRRWDLRPRAAADAACRF